MVSDDDDSFLDVPDATQDGPTSPGPVPDPQADPQRQTPVPEAGRRRAVAHVRPVSIADIVRDVAGPDPIRVIRDFDRVYMPEGAVVVTVNSAVVGEPGADRRSNLKRKAAEIPRSYSEVFAMLTSENSSQAEAARLLKTITNVASVVILLDMSMSLTRCLNFSVEVYASRYSTHFITHYG